MDAGRLETLRVTGAQGVFPNKHADLFLGNAGTAVRPLTAALALCGGEYRLTGVARMHERPIGDLVDALQGVRRRIDLSAAPPASRRSPSIPAKSALERT